MCPLDRRREASAVSRHVDEALPAEGEADEERGCRGDAHAQAAAAPRGEKPEPLAALFDERAAPDAERETFLLLSSSQGSSVIFKWVQRSFITAKKPEMSDRLLEVGAKPI